MTKLPVALATGVFLLCAPMAAWAGNESETMHDIAASAQRPQEAEDAAPESKVVEAPAPEPRGGRRGRIARSDRAPSEIKVILERKAAEHGVPFALAEAVARIESRFNPRAAHAGNFGLMQIRLQTARGEGYTGSAQGLLDAETNAHFGVKLLARAYRMANGDACGAIMRYQSGLRATHMSGANRVYCTRVKALMAYASSPS
ncbi:lytic transglycosylase domain-containing protein [Terrarubrum flagellatum]|uniref:lytic transglycosylase domain-containing protein n=1 Tax=Terrirubrum flagellatum TaxID=2895980 RepID=UPI0031451F03